MFETTAVSEFSTYETERNKPMPSWNHRYVFSAPNVYQIYRSNEVLVDTVLNIELPLDEVFQ